MARMNRLDSIEAKIERAQKKVADTGAKYEEATAALKELLDKREKIRREELIAAMAHSKRSYEDVMKYIKSR